MSPVLHSRTLKSHPCCGTGGRTYVRSLELMGSYSNQTSVRERVLTIANLEPGKRSPDEDKPKLRQRHRRLTEDQVQDLVERYLAGETVYQLGDAFDINRKTVSKILKRQGVTTRYRKLTAADLDRAVRLHESGLSLAEIGKRLDVQPSTVHYHLKQMKPGRRQP